jgi:hypothetical protein
MGSGTSTHVSTPPSAQTPPSPVAEHSSSCQLELAKNFDSKAIVADDTPGSKEMIELFAN